MERNSSANNGFLNGFLLGVIIGGMVVYLFGTKKGKKLLKVITEEGLDSISQLEEIISHDDNSQKETSKYGENDSHVSEVVENISNAAHVGEEKAIEVVSQMQRPIRRFFRNTKRKN